MSMTESRTMHSVADWRGPGAKERRAALSWHTLVWALVFPARRHRIAPTVSGIFLIVVALGIGMAAYNTANNILFITLSLLLACLLLSGLLSWFNFMGVCWRLQPLGPWRAGHDTLVSVEVANRKEWLPTYGLWFDLATQPRLAPEDVALPKDAKMKAVLAAAGKLVTRGRVFHRVRIEAGGDAVVEWGVRPERRGEATVELVAVGSLFPFGFLKKNIGTGLKRSVLVWPAQTEYQWVGAMASLAGASGRRTARAGTGEDLLALRNYTRGDSHRLIHWKASARLGKLMIRQFAAESHDGYALRLDTSAKIWTESEQFELLCRFAGTLAEDLFAAGRLRSVSINGGARMDVRRVRDVETWLDMLARVKPVASDGLKSDAVASGKNLITFAPVGARGVAAYVDGQHAASA
jgi:uncharacterized protein (DUF58 family)